MKLVLKCRRCGISYVLNVTRSEMLAWARGDLVQKAFPKLSAGERELIVSQICGKCYDKIWKETKDD